MKWQTTLLPATVILGVRRDPGCHAQIALSPAVRPKIPPKGPPEDLPPSTTTTTQAPNSDYSSSGNASFIGRLGRMENLQGDCGDVTAIACADPKTAQFTTATPHCECLAEIRKLNTTCKFNYTLTEIWDDKLPYKEEGPGLPHPANHLSASLNSWQVRGTEIRFYDYHFLTNGEVKNFGWGCDVMYRPEQLNLRTTKPTDPFVLATDAIDTRLYVTIVESAKNGCYSRDGIYTAVSTAFVGHGLEGHSSAPSAAISYREESCRSERLRLGEILSISTTAKPREKSAMLTKPARGRGEWDRDSAASVRHATSELLRAATVPLALMLAYFSFLEI